jgi:phage terminase large subunit-like protein
LYTLEVEMRRAATQSASSEHRIFDAFLRPLAAHFAPAMPDHVVDPSGADDQDNADNDEIGIIVAGLGTDGNGYLLEDCTVKAGPATWENVATSAYDRHAASCVVAERNFGGAMVRHVIQTARPRTPYREVTASRGKVQRAEPISALYEQGKIRHVGDFRQLEDELCAFSTTGYTGPRSPNRADAAIWAFTELFPGMTKPKQERKSAEKEYSGGSWMGS